MAIDAALKFSPGVAPANYRLAMQIFTRPNLNGPEVCHTINFNNARLMLRDGKHLLDNTGKDGCLMLHYEGISIIRKIIDGGEVSS